MVGPEARNLTLLREKMNAERLDALVAISKKSVLYLSNAPTAWSWQQGRADGPRLCLVVWPREGEPALIVGELEREVTREYGWIPRIEFYPDYAQTPYEKLAEVLDDMRLRGKRVGIERRVVGATYWLQLAERHRETTFIETGPLLDAVRAQKTPAEVELARQACLLLDRAFLSVFSSARPGVFEVDLHAALCETVYAMGGNEVGGSLLSGERAMVMHRPPTREPIKAGDIIRTDYHASFGGRNANLSRVAVVGDASSQQRAIYKTLREIELAIFDQIRPGVHAYDLFRFYLQQVENRGLTLRTSILGHSIGIEVHEEPMIVQAKTGTLQAGMVICIEPLILQQYHIQDQLLITQDGVEVLSTGFNTEELFVID
jgi:Xaa-Pro aminopeptidase/Xaa-Pro dipeptidase